MILLFLFLFSSCYSMDHQSTIDLVRTQAAIEMNNIKIDRKALSELADTASGATDVEVGAGTLQPSRCSRLQKLKKFAKASKKPCAFCGGVVSVAAVISVLVGQCTGVFSRF